MALPDKIGGINNMYKSPITITSKTEVQKIVNEYDDEIYKAVVSCNVKVDREELLKALRYDRSQYEKGYADGERDAMKHGRQEIETDDCDCETMCRSVCESEFYDGDNDAVDSLHRYG